jgi:hypothetical protein
LRFAISAGEKSRVPFGIPGFVAILSSNFAFNCKFRKKITIDNSQFTISIGNWQLNVQVYKTQKSRARQAGATIIIYKV